MKVVDLFCGCGGLSLGFEKAGMEIVAAFDNWVDALSVYRNNFSHPAIRADLTNIEDSVKMIRSYTPDMIIGGLHVRTFRLRESEMRTMVEATLLYVMRKLFRR